MCRPPRIPTNLEERTARRNLPATFVGFVLPAIKIVLSYERQAAPRELSHAANA
jgi:hypothetical protein